MNVMRTLSELVALAVFTAATCVSVLAQEPGTNRDRGDRGKRDRNPEERFIETMKGDLGLNDEQLAKVRDLMKENQEAVKKASETRDAKIREMLSEEQAAKFDELRKQKQPGQGRQGGQDGEGGGRSPFGRAGRFGRQAEGADEGAGNDRLPDIIRNVVKNLDLTDEQKAKVKELLPDLQQTVTEALKGIREGGMDPRAAMEKLGAIRDELLEKIKPLLNEEQLKKLAEASSKGGRKLSEMLQGGQRPGGPQNPEQMMKMKLEAIRKDLDTIPEVWAILSEKIEGILKLETEYRKQAREMGDQARDSFKDATDEQIKEKMEAFRALRKKLDEEIKAKREDLRELLDLREEAKLIIHGVLD